jgi:hypothetical protein
MGWGENKITLSVKTTAEGVRLAEAVGDWEPRPAVDASAVGKPPDGWIEHLAGIFC